MKEREIAGVKVFVSNETYNEYKGTLQEQLEEKDKEIQRLNNIIDEMEKELKKYSNKLEYCSESVAMFYSVAICNDINNILNKLKELKERNNK